MQPPCSRVRDRLMLEASPYSCTEVKNFDLDKIGIKKRDSPFDREPRAALMYLISKKLARGLRKFYSHPTFYPTYRPTAAAHQNRTMSALEAAFATFICN